MRKILAVSGGIDSMVLLHKFRNDPSVLVAHFNHGTRPSANDDEKFVEKSAKVYGLEFVSGHANLGENASEEAARYARYEFFSKICEEYNGELYTAHHARDLIESIAINLLRGTGWRGLVPFGNTKINRPLLEIKKSEIYRYAAKNNLTFREDPTNSDEAYLRNRLRPKIANLDEKTSEALIKLYHDTHNLKLFIDALDAEILDQLAPAPSLYPRAPFANLDEKTSEELLRAALKRAGISATRPKIRDFLDAIKTYRPGKRFNLPKSRLVKFSKTSFSL